MNTIKGKNRLLHFYLGEYSFSLQMSTEDDLLSNFFAEIDKLPTNTASTPKEENVGIGVLG